MDYRLEVVVVPVSDVERAKAFYSEQLGFNVDHDTQIGDDMRIAQLTPQGSGCSIVIGTAPPLPDMPPGSLSGLQLVVTDMEPARAELVERGLPLPAYDQVLKCSHAFNLLDARGAISVTERAGYIGRVRNLARRVAELYVESLAEPAV